MKKKLAVGIVKRHPDGFGFLIPDDPNQVDVYIPKHEMVGIMTSDRVMVDVLPEPGGQRFRGEIVKVMSRGVKIVVGRLEPFNDRFFILPDESHAWGEDLKIKVEDILGAKAGDLVAAEILSYPDRDKKFTARVKEVIGDAADPLNDVKRVLIQQNIPQDFSASTQAEVARLSEEVEPKDFAGRKDIQSLPLITIDGVTAKDFDDAVYTEMTDVGFKLYVAIADVSHYVRPGTALDKDAYERGTSVYFPNFVVPMLPEILSNGLCSLRPNTPRLCLVAEMDFDFTGVMQNSSFYEAVMLSHARVTYGEAQEVVDGVEVEKLHHVRGTILRCADLAKVLMAKRFREGSLDLDIPEVQLEIDATGNPVDVIRSERLFAHRLIEELMLAANVAVAKFLDSKQIPAIYRIHEDPNQDAISTLQTYMHNMGVKFGVGGGKLQKKLTRALQEFENKPEGHIVNILTLRSMAQAKYSPNNVGHFGLGFETYTHFTSPIRRYPDLIVHRLIKSQILPQKGYRTVDEDDLATAGTILSACEQRAVKAERQFNAIKKARFMQKFEGQEFVGIISSVAKFGIFVLLREYEIDGLVRLEGLGRDQFEFDEQNLRLIGKRSKKVFSIGNEVKVMVLRADPEAGQVDFELDKLHQAFEGKQVGGFSSADSGRGRRPERRESKVEPVSKSTEVVYSKKETKSVWTQLQKVVDSDHMQDLEEVLEQEEVERLQNILEKIKKYNLDRPSQAGKGQKQGKKFEAHSNRKNDRKNSKKRGKAKNHRRGVR